MISSWPKKSTNLKNRNQPPQKKQQKIKSNNNNVIFLVPTQFMVPTQKRITRQPHAKKRKRYHPPKKKTASRTHEFQAGGAFRAQPWPPPLVRDVARLAEATAQAAVCAGGLPGLLNRSPFCPFETWLFQHQNTVHLKHVAFSTPKCRETTICKAMFRCNM